MTISTAQALIQALDLPEGCRVDQRVPKKLLVENGATTAADKRLISEAIEEIQWIAALKPNTVGVPDYRDAHREYLEIAVLLVSLRGAVKAASSSRIAELIHRAVPYPALLFMVEGQVLNISLTHKRWSQNESDKVVLDGNMVSASLAEPTLASSEPTVPIEKAETERLFRESLSVARQSQSSLYAVYQGWIDCVLTLLAARLTGRYRAAPTPKQADERRRALAESERIDTHLNRLRVQAAKEKQMARQVSINLEIKALLAERQRIEQFL